MSPGWQCVDIAVRALKGAIKAKDMQKLPIVVATLQARLDVISQLLVSYATGGQGGPSTPAVQSDRGGRASDGDAQATDADAQPSAPEDSGGGS